MSDKMSENLKKISFRLSPKRYNLIKEGLPYEFSYQTKISKYIRAGIDLLLFFDSEILFEEIEDEDLKGRIKLEKQTLPRLALNMERDRIEKEQLYDKIVNTFEETKKIGGETTRRILEVSANQNIFTMKNILALKTLIESTDDERLKKQYNNTIDELNEIREQTISLMDDVSIFL